MPDSFGKGRGRHKKDCLCIKCIEKKAMQKTKEGFEPNKAEISEGSQKEV